MTNTTPLNPRQEGAAFQAHYEGGKGCRRARDRPYAELTSWSTISKGQRGGKVSPIFFPLAFAVDCH
jgi:hypothetical protein